MNQTFQKGGRRFSETLVLSNGSGLTSHGTVNTNPFYPSANVTVSQNCRRKMWKSIHFERDEGDIQGPKNTTNLGPHGDVTYSHPNSMFTSGKMKATSKGLLYMIKLLNKALTTDLWPTSYVT